MPQAIHSLELDGTRTNKVELIAHLMAEEGLDPAQTLMIGGRTGHDHVGLGGGKSGLGAGNVGAAAGANTATTIAHHTFGNGEAAAEPQFDFLGMGMNMDLETFDWSV